MSFNALAINRRSCREYDPNKEVKKELIEKVIEAGLHAPTGMNLQNTKVIAITNKEVRNKLAKINASIGNFNIDPFYMAPVVLIVISKKSALSVYDGAAMIENMLLQAFDLGLSSCWIHRAKEEIESKEVQELLKSTKINFDEYEGIGHVILGYGKNKNVGHKEIKKDRVFWIK